MVENLERQNETDEFEKTRRRYGRKQETIDLGYMLRHKDEPVDVVSESFVNAYVDRFNPETVEWSSYGAPKVFELGRLLANCIKKTKLADTGIIVRTGRTAIQNGFMFIIHYE